MRRAVLFLAAIAVASTAWAQQPGAGAGGAVPGGPGAPAGRQGGGSTSVDVPWNDAIPPGTADHAARALKESSRHQEWVDIKLADGTALRSFVVHPERSTRAGVVIVIHDIRGMSDIARAAGDQLAQDGFIAIVPDFLSGKGPNGGGTESLGAGVGPAIQRLTADEVNARLNAAMEYGRRLPGSNGKTAVTGFCWGGARTFGFAAAQPNLNAAVVFYGEAPGSTDNTHEVTLANLKAPVLGFYAGNDARINNTLPGTEAAMAKLGKSFEKHIYEGAGHGFMGNQAGSGGANLKAAAQAWPAALAFFRKHLN
jgi:carboxymethylenebutenolidase